MEYFCKECSYAKFLYAPVLYQHLNALRLIDLYAGQLGKHGPLRHHDLHWNHLPSMSIVLGDL